MSFPRYERYKDSMVEWLGEVPEDWEVKRLRFVALVNPSKSELGNINRDLAVSFVPMEAINERSSPSLTEERTLGDVEAGYTYFRDGDVAIAKITPCFENGKRAHFRGLSNGIGFGTTELHVLRARQETSIARFLFWLTASSAFMGMGEGSMYGTGGQKRVADNFVRDYDTALPPIHDQSVISDFLDTETVKIDELIEEQRRLIELLKEKRQAIISRAVTKGLNPDAPMKDSEVEWMASIPVHWRVLSLGRITDSACDGPFGSGLKSDHYVDAGIRVIRLQNIRDGVFDGTDAAFIDPVHYADLGDHDVISGDLLIAGLGDERNAVGRACVAPSEIEPAMVKADCFRFRLTHDALPEFIAAQLSIGAPTDAGRLATGSTRSRIPVSKMSSRPVAIPSVEEQSVIVSYLGRREAEFAGLRSQAELGINLLQERRSALISATVTGKIDVRKYTPRETA